MEPALDIKKYPFCAQKLPVLSLTSPLLVDTSISMHDRVSTLPSGWYPLDPLHRLFAFHRSQLVMDGDGNGGFSQSATSQQSWRPEMEKPI